MGALPRRAARLRRTHRTLKPTRREIVILWAGRHERSDWETLCVGYRDRLRHLAPVRDVAVRARLHANDPGRRRAEADALRDAAGRDAWIVALDRQGEMLSSEVFASRLAALRETWSHPVAFVIGSDLGLDLEALSPRWTLSFGPVTLSHPLARLVLHEQLFRALSIGAGMSYHRQPP